MSKLVYGVGVNDKTVSTCSNGIPRKEYRIWKKMLERCYSPTFHKRQPTYSECTVSNNFKSYSYFYNWCQNQIGFGIDGFELDKDIVEKDNNIYSEDTCFFIPKQLNMLTVVRNKSRGSYLIGVSFHKRDGVYTAQYSENGKSVYIGSFKTELEAFYAYKKNRESYILRAVNRYKEDIDKRAYELLTNYKIRLHY